MLGAIVPSVRWPCGTSAVPVLVTTLLPPSWVSEPEYSALELANSSTGPVTVTTSPTDTSGLLRKTRMPSLVRGLPSSVVLCRKKPP